MRLIVFEGMDGLLTLSTFHNSLELPPHSGRAGEHVLKGAGPGRNAWSSAPAYEMTRKDMTARFHMHGAF